MNNSLKGTNSRITETEEWINGLEEKMVEITATEYRKKNENKNEKSLRDL